MDFQSTGVLHTRPVQEHMERQHANFHQLPLLKAFFDERFPRTHPSLSIEEFTQQRNLGIGITAIVCLYKRLPLEALVNLFKHEAAQTIASCCEALVKGRWLGWDENREEFVTPVLPTELHQQVFNKRYPMPMLCPPEHLWQETDSPYLTEPKGQSVLGEYNGQVTNLATLNALNAIPLQLNPAVIKAAPDPFKDDDKFRRDSAEVFGRIQDEVFYLTWQFDFRGRVYARGYHVNPQGDDWHKHVIQFATE